jgi:hypothetical protein
MLLAYQKFVHRPGKSERSARCSELVRNGGEGGLGSCSDRRDCSDADNNDQG